MLWVFLWGLARFILEARGHWGPSPSRPERRRFETGVGIFLSFSTVNNRGASETGGGGEPVY